MVMIVELPTDGFRLLKMENFDFWYADENTDVEREMKYHGAELTAERILELVTEYPRGFFLRGWNKYNNDTKPDEDLTPDETRVMKFTEE